MKTSDQDECVLCCREITIFAVGACDHPVCHECSARMRVLCETNECPICRSNMPMVICTSEKKPYSEISQKYSIIDRKFQVVFQNNYIQKAFQLLLENRCKECDEVFHTFNKLKDHVRREHSLQYCELCTENLKIFPFERKTYNRKDLARHKRVGDPDETSHRGHPLCEFCDQRYVDSDELFRHLRREHYFCHFCDADGKHQYYEDYDYLRVHFRKEHYLCEEGDCANEQFIGAFRTEIDLKAHIAVHHSKNKTKAEARQARMLEVEFTYAHHNRPNGNSSPRGNRFNKRQNVVEQENSSRENKPSHQAAVESIDTQSTLEFPYLSEDGENSSVPSTNVNSMTLQSFLRNPVPQRRKNVMSSEDFPALVSTVQGPTLNYSTSVSVTSEVSNNQSRKFNFSYHQQNNVPARASNVSIHLSQKCAQPRVSEASKETDNKSQKPLWISKKSATSFEDEFPKLESKKLPVSTKPLATYTNVVNTTIVNDVSNRSSAAVEVSNPPGNSVDQFVIIKGKSKKKKHRNVCMENRATDNKDEGDEEASNASILMLSNNNFNALDDENSKYKKNMLRTNSSKTRYIEEESWQQKVSFGKDDFPPLAPTDVVRKPPGFNCPKKKAPPPGFSANSNSHSSAPLNISLSSIARQIVTVGVNKTAETAIPQSNYTYKNPVDVMHRNDELTAKIKELCVYDEFRTLAMEFKDSKITAADYYAKCLDILGEKDFFDIFPELICLLPIINKQQELLDVHRKYQNHQNNSGAVPKQKVPNNQICVCDICYQVLLERDYEAHISDHN